jgi:1-deoxy-D-xylulose-5-phosphate reductoisomerase
VTVEQALAHPTWEMGQKITVDSATMMNKSLEIIEARWLFDVQNDQIEVVIHPQSIVHSLVEFIDGSVMAQMSPPDMKLPIQYALTYPERRSGAAPRLDMSQPLQLDFYPPDTQRFPALELGYEVAKFGGSTGAVLNAANEAAVSAFLNRKISFTDIVAACREILDQHNYEPHPTLDQLMAADRWARREMCKWIVA